MIAEGKEYTEITESESTGSSSSSGSSSTTTRTYSESNPFYSEDVSHLLRKSVSINVLEDGTLQISPQSRETAFEFKLPNDDSIFSSYNGKHAKIFYSVKATLDIAKRMDVNKEEHFSLFNPNNNKVASPAINVENMKSADVPNTDKDKDENDLPSSRPKEEELGKESYSTRFERIFGKKSNHTTISYNRPPPRSFTFSGTGLNINLGSLFAKNRQHFLEENSRAKIELLNDNGNKPYSPGHMVRGKVMLQTQNHDDKGEKKSIKGMKITLSGMEHAFAQGLQRITTIEKHEIDSELADNGGENNDDSTVPFEFRIPRNVKQSYIGKYSEYFWGLEAKLNIAWTSDIKTRTIIEIV